MKLVIPLWATDPTAALRAGGICEYQGSVSSRRERVAVAKSPAMDLSQGRCLGVTTSRSAGSGSYVMKPVFVDRTLGHACIQLSLRSQLLKDSNGN